jgi:ABC-type multidrug transport system fused ATPase/permease subunit
VKIPLQRYRRLLAGYLAPHWPWAFALGVLLCMAIGLELASPLVLRYFIDTATAHGPLNSLILTALAYMVVSALGQGISVFEQYVAEWIGWTATNLLRGDLALHCLRLDLSFHNRHTAGELIERIDGDVSALANFFARFIIYVLGNVLLLVGMIVLLWLVDWRIGLETALFAVFILLSMLRLYRVAQPIWVAVDQASALFYGFLGERLAGTEDLRSCGAVPYVLRGFTEHLRRWFPLEMKATLISQLVWVVALNLFALAIAAALGVSTYLVQHGAMTIGTMYLVFQYVSLLIRPISQLQAQIQDLQQAGAALERVEELLGTPASITDGPGAAVSPGAPAVSYDGVCFRYDTGDTILHDITCELAPGTILGVLGRTGSGKTTFARLLLRLYDPTAGAIRLNGVDLREMRLSDLRGRIGMVTQEVQIFAATVRDNLTFFDRTIDDEHLEAVITELGLRIWYEGLPHGLDTQLAPNSGSLSAGEAQLLALVRVFLKDPGLVALDEASARLDPLTEAMIDRAMERLLRNRTGIIIAHRLAAVRRATRIMILDDGRIVEDGAPDSLARDPRSRFHQLLHSDQEGVVV